MAIKVMFDSNVWRKIASPTMFSQDPDKSSILSIRDKINAKRIEGFICETSFTLEQIKRDERLNWLLEKSRVSVTSKEKEDGSIHMQVKIGGNGKIKPQANSVVSNHLHDAYSLGIRVLRSNRISGPMSDLLKEKHFLSQSINDFDYPSYGEVLRALEALGLGITNLQSLGLQNRKKNTDNWISGLNYLSDEDKNRIPDLIAEWADLDSISTSIANGMFYFCTYDSGKGAKGKNIDTIFEMTNIRKVVNKYNLEIGTPSQLLSRLN